MVFTCEGAMQAGDRSGVRLLNRALLRDVVCQWDRGRARPLFRRHLRQKYHIRTFERLFLAGRRSRANVRLWPILLKKSAMVTTAEK